MDAISDGGYGDATQPTDTGILCFCEEENRLYHMLKTRQHWKWENPLLTEKKMTRLAIGGDEP